MAGRRCQLLPSPGGSWVHAKTVFNCTTSHARRTGATLSRRQRPGQRAATGRWSGCWPKACPPNGWPLSAATRPTACAALPSAITSTAQRAWATGAIRHPGAAGLLSPAQQAELAQALDQPRLDGGRWTSPKGVAWMAAILGRPIHPQRGWEMLRRLGWTSKLPRSCHAKADPQTQAAFKKPTSRSPDPAAGAPTVEGRAVGHRPASHRPRPYRASRLESPRAVPGSGVPHPNPWCYLYAFVHPPAGRTVWLLLPTTLIKQVID
jgi:transposase